MKLIIACITIFISGYYPLYAQNNADYFPYEKNNYWEYFWLESGYPDTIVSLSVFDSVDNQGRKIAIFDSYFINPIKPPVMLPDSGVFYIDTALNVMTDLYWDSIPKPEIIHKLNGEMGDQWVIYDYSQIGGQGYEMARIKEISNNIVLGVPTQIMWVVYYGTADSTDTTGLDRGYDALAKGFGLQFRQREGWPGILLKGAVIDGILYGDTTNIIVGIDETNQFNQPESFELYQNYPNPFNPHTTIKFELHESKNISLVIYNTLGKEVIKLIDDNFYKAGTYEKTWSGTDSGGNKVRSGVYFYIIKAENFSETKKMILIH